MPVESPPSSSESRAAPWDDATVPDRPPASGSPCACPPDEESPRFRRGLDFFGLELAQGARHVAKHREPPGKGMNMLTYSHSNCIYIYGGCLK